MRILVAGAGRAGARTLRQLKKNPDLTVITLDPRENPYAVQRGIIEAVDIQEVFTPLTLEYVLEKARPDLVLLATSTRDLGLGEVSGIDVLAQSLRDELTAISRVPMIEVSHKGQ